MSSPIVFALPKGRIQKELAPLLLKVGIKPEKAYFDDEERQLQFATESGEVSIIRVRSFDAATFVAFGAAQLGVAGSDVLMEFDYQDLYAPLDLGIGHCRLSLAGPKGKQADLSQASHVKVATKYPNATRRYFAQKGIQAECIKLNGAMELAPKLGLAPYIVDLVSSGQTLKANGLEEIDVIAPVSSRLIVNRAAFKTQSTQVSGWIEKFRQQVRRA